MPEKLKRLATTTDKIVTVHCPVSEEELADRQKDYPKLSCKNFSKRTVDFLYRPVIFDYDDRQYQIQYNFCTDPFCAWFGMSQESFKSIRKPIGRYRLSGTGEGLEKIVFACNEDKYNNDNKMYVSSKVSIALSNWSIAEEIGRLAKIQKIVAREPEYKFHKDHCAKLNTTPSNNPKNFYAYGKSTSNSQRWKCLDCNKVTNVLPQQKECFTYKQRRNDILVNFADLIIRGIAVKEICSHLGIGMQTYYNKLEWVYRRCLEFLERHERENFKKLSFERLWLNTDQMVYFLNNTRKKGCGTASRLKNEPHLETRIIATGELKSFYILRADINYDWDISLDQIEADTLLYREDHIHEFARKNARFTFQFKPQPPLGVDDQSNMFDYENALEEFNIRTSYVDGIHINPTYTTIAHYWHIKNLVQAKKWNIVTDSDNSLMTAFFRIFANEVKDGYAHHYTYKIDRTKSIAKSLAEFLSGNHNLQSWASESGQAFDKRRKYQSATLQMAEKLRGNRLYSVAAINGKNFTIPTEIMLTHPLPSYSHGYYEVGCSTDLSMFSDDYIASNLINVSGQVTDMFFEKLRRKVNILERPLDTARPGEKCYIYANYNPRYAQYLTTILRTVHNFCTPLKTKDGLLDTPAQRLGLVTKTYTIKDILYLS